MEIIRNENTFNVVENDVVLYAAMSLEEANGFIDWKNRPPEDSGSNEECVTC